MFKFIHTHIIEFLGVREGYERGWGNGYVGVPWWHPWYNLGYSDIQCPIHGGLTFSSHIDTMRSGVWNDIRKFKNYYWVGFDTAHYEDNLILWPKMRVISETEYLKRQALKALLPHIYFRYLLIKTLKWILSKIDFNQY